MFEDPAIVIARRNNHKPFFWISYALNEWAMAQALGWDLSSTLVLRLNTGYSSPIDALHQQLYFTNRVVMVPFEVSGQHLNYG